MRRLLASGTTTAVYYGSIHLEVGALTLTLGGRLMVLPYHIGYWASPEVGVEINPNPSPIALAPALALH